MATNLPWEEKLNVFQIDPRQATLEDISKMATELIDELNEEESYLSDLKKLYTDLCKKSANYTRKIISIKQDELKEVYNNRNIGLNEAIKWLRNFIERRSMH
jgi:hypothetical protein